MARCRPQHWGLWKTAQKAENSGAESAEHRVSASNWVDLLKLHFGRSSRSREETPSIAAQRHRRASPPS